MGGWGERGGRFSFRMDMAEGLREAGKEEKEGWRWRPGWVGTGVGAEAEAEGEGPPFARCCMTSAIMGARYGLSRWEAIAWCDVQCLAALVAVVVPESARDWRFQGDRGRRAGWEAISSWRPAGTFGDACTGLVYACMGQSVTVGN